MRAHTYWYRLELLFLLSTGISARKNPIKTCTCASFRIRLRYRETIEFTVNHTFLSVDPISQTVPFVNRGGSRAIRTMTKVINGYNILSWQWVRGSVAAGKFGVRPRRASIVRCRKKHNIPVSVAFCFFYLRHVTKTNTKPTKPEPTRRYETRATNRNDKQTKKVHPTYCV